MVCLQAGNEKSMQTPSPHRIAPHRIAPKSHPMSTPYLPSRFETRSLGPEFWFEALGPQVGNIKVIMWWVGLGLGVFGLELWRAWVTSLANSSCTYISSLKVLGLLLRISHHHLLTMDSKGVKQQVEELLAYFHALQTNAEHSEDEWLCDVQGKQAYPSQPKPTHWSRTKKPGNS